MKNLLLITAILFSGMIAKAQDIFFPTTIGTVLDYKSYDKKDKETGKIRYTITETSSDGDNMDITYMIETTDANDKPLFKHELTIQKKGDNLYVDMRKFLDKAIFKKGGKVPDNLKITGNEMEIPSNLKVGDALPDSHMEMSFKMGFINIKMGAQVTDRLVESAENIAVEAGNFDVYKLTSSVSANAMGMKTSSTTAEWIAKGIGMVKSETYDKNGEVSSYTELVSLKE